MLLRAFHAHADRQRLAARVRVRPRQPQPADLRHAQAVPVQLDGLGNGEGRHGAVPGLEAGLALGLGILEVSLVGIGQVLQAVAHAVERIVLQPGVIRVIAQLGKPPAQGEEGRNGLGSDPVGLPQAVPVFLVGQHVVPDIAAGPGNGRQQDAGGGVARIQAQAYRAVDGLRLLCCRMVGIGHERCNLCPVESPVGSRALLFAGPHCSTGVQGCACRTYRVGHCFSFVDAAAAWMPACVRKPRVCGARRGHRRPEPPSYRRCHAIENPLGRGGFQALLCIQASQGGWPTTTRRRTTFHPSSPATHPGPAPSARAAT